MRDPAPHPLDHHPSFHALIAAAPPLAALASQLPDLDLVGPLVRASSDLAHGFAAPPDSRRRTRAHHRAWATIRALDREIAAIGRRRSAPPTAVALAQRAIDRADVLVGALLPD